MLQKPNYHELEQKLRESEKTIKALKETTQRFNRLVKNSPDMIYCMSLSDGRYKYVSPAAKNIFGYSLKTWYENPFFIRDILHPDFLPYFATQWKNLLKGDIPQTYVYKIIHKDKTERWINQRNILIKNDTGNPLALEGILTDITACKQVKENLLQSKKRLDLVIKGSSDAPWDWDLLTNEPYYSPQWWSQLGYTPDELPADASLWKKLMHPEDTEHVNSVFMVALRDGSESYEVELRLLHKQGYYVPVLSRGFITRNATGQPIRVSGTNMDLSERKKSEEQIKSALKEKEILLRELYHRTKNNMQIICCMLSIESMQIKDKELLTQFAGIENRIRVMALVHKKLCETNDLSKIDLKGYLQDIGDYLLTNSLKPGRISLQVDGDSIPILIDYAVPCGLIINELISNSQRHAFPNGNDGEILIIVKGFSNKIEITFRDNGIGLPNDFNLESCKSFGLGIVRDLIKGQLHGKVELKKTQGVSFQIKFEKSLYKKRI